MLWLNQSSPEDKTRMGIHFIQTIKLFLVHNQPVASKPDVKNAYESVIEYLNRAVWDLSVY